MKKYLNVKNIILLISILIIIAGTVTLCLYGFEKSIEYKAGTRIEVYIPNLYEKEDVIQIAKESFETEDFLFVEIEELNQVAGIKVAEYTEEQLENFKNKISEKYGIDKEELEIHTALVPETKIATLVKPYLSPLFFVTTLILIYIIIKNIKTNNGARIPLKVLGILVITLCLYFSLISLFRLQFSIYTLPLALAIYIVTLLIAVNKKWE